MTNAVDVLAVGGPATNRVWCLNRNAQGFPHTIQVPSLDPAGVLDYTPRRFWNTVTERWYWIATWSGDEPTDSEIQFIIAVNDFPPAWDMATRAAPEVQA